MLRVRSRALVVVARVCSHSTGETAAVRLLWIEVQPRLPCFRQNTRKEIIKEVEGHWDSSPFGYSTGFAFSYVMPLCKSLSWFSTAGHCPTLSFPQTFVLRIYFYEYGCLACILHHMRVIPTEARRGRWIHSPGTRVTRQL